MHAKLLARLLLGFAIAICLFIAATLVVNPERGTVEFKQASLFSNLSPLVYLIIGSVLTGSFGLLGGYFAHKWAISRQDRERAAQIVHVCRGLCQEITTMKEVVLSMESGLLADVPKGKALGQEIVGFAPADDLYKAHAVAIVQIEDDDTIERLINIYNQARTLAAIIVKHNTALNQYQKQYAQAPKLDNGSILPEDPMSQLYKQVVITTKGVKITCKNFIVQAEYILPRLQRYSSMLCECFNLSNSK